MKLKTFCDRYESRAKCAEALGVSPQHLTNLINKYDTEVVQLMDGRWMTLTKYNKCFKA